MYKVKSMVQIELDYLLTELYSGVVSNDHYSENLRLDEAVTILYFADVIDEDTFSAYEEEILRVCYK